MRAPITLLEDAEAIVAGMPVARALRAMSPDTVTFQLGAASLARAMWSLPILDAVRALYPRAALSFRARPGAARLLAAHTSSSTRRVAPRAGDLVVDLSPRARQTTIPLDRTTDIARLAVARAPFAARPQHAWAHWVDGAHLAGLPVEVAPPVLRLPRRAHREARALCRALAGLRGGPIVALAPARAWPAASFACVLGRLRRRVGALGVVLGPAEIPGAVRLPDVDPVVAASFLSLCAVCVADDGGWAHVGAAVGAPTVTVHGRTSPLLSGPACRHGAALFTTRGTCDPCARSPGRRCLACLDPERVAEVAENLAARRWPLDRLARALP
jgi:ADP-heptose:LPS heptosyltransferase